MAHKWTKKGIEGYRKTHGGAYPPGQEPDPSADWLDVLGGAKTRWSQERATRQDSFALGKLPEKPIKDSEIMREYQARRKLAIAAGETPTETDKALGIVRKADEPAKGESPQDARMRYIKRRKEAIESLAEQTPILTAEGEQKEEYLFPEGSPERKALKDEYAMMGDSLEVAEKAKSIGITDMSDFASSVNKLKKIAPEYLRIRSAKGEEAANKFLMEEAEMTREQAVYFMTTLGYQGFGEPGIKLKGRPRP